MTRKNPEYTHGIDLSFWHDPITRYRLLKPEHAGLSDEEIQEMLDAQSDPRTPKPPLVSRKKTE